MQAVLDAVRVRPMTVAELVVIVGRHTDRIRLAITRLQADGKVEPVAVERCPTCGGGKALKWGVRK